MTDKEMMLYGAMGVWVVLNLIVFWWTNDEAEFYDDKNPDKPLPWHKIAYFAAFGTIPAHIRLLWNERRDR